VHPSAQGVPPSRHLHPRTSVPLPPDICFFQAAPGRVQSGWRNVTMWAAGLLYVSAVPSDGSNSHFLALLSLRRWRSRFMNSALQTWAPRGPDANAWQHPVPFWSPLVYVRRRETYRVHTCNRIFTIHKESIGESTVSRARRSSALFLKLNSSVSNLLWFLYGWCYAHWKPPRSYERPSFSTWISHVTWGGRRRNHEMK
jgi:hypothetical protein